MPRKKNGSDSALVDTVKATTVTKPKINKTENNMKKVTPKAVVVNVEVNLKAAINKFKKAYLSRTDKMVDALLTVESEEIVTLMEKLVVIYIDGSYLKMESKKKQLSNAAYKKEMSKLQLEEETGTLNGKARKVILSLLNPVIKAINNQLIVKEETVAENPQKPVKNLREFFNEYISKVNLDETFLNPKWDRDGDDKYQQVLTVIRNNVCSKVFVNEETGEALKGKAFEEAVNVKTKSVAEYLYDKYMLARESKASDANENKAVAARTKMQQIFDAYVSKVSLEDTVKNQYWLPALDVKFQAMVNSLTLAVPFTDGKLWPLLYLFGIRYDAKAELTPSNVVALILEALYKRHIAINNLDAEVTVENKTESTTSTSTSSKPKVKYHTDTITRKERETYNNNLAEVRKDRQLREANRKEKLAKIDENKSEYDPKRHHNYFDILDDLSLKDTAQTLCDFMRANPRG